jgi:hypothetical protein
LIQNLINQGLAKEHSQETIKSIHDVKIGSIFFRASYNNPSFNHTGIVVSVNIERDEFCTVEGNFGKDGLTEKTTPQMTEVGYGTYKYYQIARENYKG